MSTLRHLIAHGLQPQASPYPFPPPPPPCPPGCPIAKSDLSKWQTPPSSLTPSAFVYSPDSASNLAQLFIGWLEKQGVMDKVVNEDAERQISRALTEFSGPRPNYKVANHAAAVFQLCAAVQPFVRIVETLLGRRATTEICTGLDDTVIIKPSDLPCAEQPFVLKRDRLLRLALRRPHGSSAEGGGAVGGGNTSGRVEGTSQSKQVQEREPAPSKGREGDEHVERVEQGRLPVMVMTGLPKALIEVNLVEASFRTEDVPAMPTPVGTLYPPAATPGLFTRVTELFKSQSVLPPLEVKSQQIRDFLWKLAIDLRHERLPLNFACDTRQFLLGFAADVPQSFYFAFSSLTPIAPTTNSPKDPPLLLLLSTVFFDDFIQWALPLLRQSVLKEIDPPTDQPGLRKALRGPGFFRSYAMFKSYKLSACTFPAPLTLPHSSFRPSTAPSKSLSLSYPLNHGISVFFGILGNGTPIVAKTSLGNKHEDVERDFYIRSRMELLASLARIHKLGIVHGNIDPSNVVLPKSTSTSSAPRARWIDFSCAQEGHLCEGSNCLELQDAVEELGFDGEEAEEDVRALRRQQGLLWQ
ncbi:hypothetical protein JCM11251_003310 [Rhodosporidiobolus azoricus]